MLVICCSFFIGQPVRCLTLLTDFMSGYVNWLSCFHHVVFTVSFVMKVYSVYQHRDKRVDIIVVY